MTLIKIDLQKLQETMDELTERCRQREARIALLENALTVARLKHQEDEELAKHFRELMNDDYRPDQIDLAKAKPMTLVREQENN